MLRIQFYPSAALLQSINADATRLGIATSTLVRDILERYYGLVPENTLTDSQLNTIVFAEVENFISTCSVGAVFDLYRASQTFRDIEMYYAGKPSAVRARIGKAFATKQVGTGVFSQVAPNIVNGRLVISSNKAATYLVI